jgi:hypothetical protein
VFDVGWKLEKVLRVSRKMMGLLNVFSGVRSYLIPRPPVRDRHEFGNAIVRSPKDLDAQITRGSSELLYPFFIEILCIRFSE